MSACEGREATMLPPNVAEYKRKILVNWKTRVMASWVRDPPHMASVLEAIALLCFDAVCVALFSWDTSICE